MFHLVFGTLYANFLNSTLDIYLCGKNKGPRECESTLRGEAKGVISTHNTEHHAYSVYNSMEGGLAFQGDSHPFTPALQILRRGTRMSSIYTICYTTSSQWWQKFVLPPSPLKFAKLQYLYACRPGLCVFID